MRNSRKCDTLIVVGQPPYTTRKETEMISTHLFVHLTADDVTAEMTNGMLSIELRDGENGTVFLNLTGDIVDVARKLGNPTVKAKKENANA